MAVKHRDANTLEADVNAIFDNIGKEFILVLFQKSAFANSVTRQIAF